MYVHTQMKLSDKALAKVAALKPNLLSFNNGSDFNTEYNKANHTFVPVRYQDRTGEKRLVPPTTSFIMDYDRVEEFRAAIKAYHEALIQAQEEVLAEYEDFHEFGEHDYLDKRNYRYFQRVGTDLGFSDISTGAVNSFVQYVNQTIEGFYEDKTEEEIEEMDKMHVYQLTEEEGKFVLGSHAAPRVECDCSWQNFGQCHHALQHVVTEATYDTMEEAVESLVAKSKELGIEEDVLVITDKQYFVVLTAGALGFRTGRNCDIPNADLWDKYQQETSKNCNCVDGYCYCDEEYYEEHQQEGPFGGAFASQEDYEDWRFGGISYLNKI